MPAITYYKDTKKSIGDLQKIMEDRGEWRKLEFARNKSSQS